MSPVNPLAMSHNSTAKSVREDKEQHPERYCPKCLWKVLLLNHDTQQHNIVAPGCKGGRCPRHGGTS